MKEIFDAAIKKHGINGKLAKLREESIELALAVERYLACRDKSPENLFEEIADVKNVIAQIELFSQDFTNKINTYQIKKAQKLKKILDDPS
ncbi:MAG: hypothetical protein ACOC2E_00055 [Bacteroidota bacterium]